jgi:hypothetical protein
MHLQLQPIISLEKFFYDEPNLDYKPLANHDLEQSPCYAIIDTRWYKQGFHIIIIIIA